MLASRTSIYFDIADEIVKANTRIIEAKERKNNKESIPQKAKTRQSTINQNPIATILENENGIEVSIRF